MKLAWQNIIHDRSRFSVTVLGVSFAVFLMVFQGSLLVGFLRAASRLIDASDSDIWITARGVQAFEFGTTLESRVREMAAGVPGVMQTDRVCMAFAVYRTPKGKQQVVALVGADPNVGKRFPVPDVPELAGEISPDAVLYDVSDRDLLPSRHCQQKLRSIVTAPASSGRSKVMARSLAFLFCSLPIATPSGISVSGLTMPCTSCCESARAPLSRMSNKVCRNGFRKSMYSLGTNLLTNPACIGR